MGPQRFRFPVRVQPGRLIQRLGVGRLWIELVSQTGQLTLAKKTGQSGTTPGILQLVERLGLDLTQRRANPMASCSTESTFHTGNRTVQLAPITRCRLLAEQLGENGAETLPSDHRRSLEGRLWSRNPRPGWGK